jgi:DNA-binding NtrC family response regulator
MNITVVVVDDEADIRFLVKTILEAEGCKVLEAGDGASLRRFFAQPAPDVVILDLKLPDASGLDLLREVKRNWPTAKVIILTGYGTAEAGEEAYKIADVFLQNKPFDGEMLKAMLELALTQKFPSREY